MKTNITIVYATGSLAAVSSVIINIPLLSPSSEIFVSQRRKIYQIQVSLEPAWITAATVAPSVIYSITELYPQSQAGVDLFLNLSTTPSFVDNAIIYDVWQPDLTILAGSGVGNEYLSRTYDLGGTEIYNIHDGSQLYFNLLVYNNAPAQVINPYKIPIKIMLRWNT
jgi:hypothetical protein